MYESLLCHSFSELSNRPKSMSSPENEIIPTCQPAKKGENFFQGVKDRHCVTIVSRCCATAPLKRVKQPFSERSLALSLLKSDATEGEGVRGGGQEGTAERDFHSE